MSRKCEDCDGSGVRREATPHSGEKAPSGWEVVERCDTCEQFENDFAAARSLSKRVHERHSERGSDTIVWIGS